MWLGSLCICTPLTPSLSLILGLPTDCPRAPLPNSLKRDSDWPNLSRRSALVHQLRTREGGQAMAYINNFRGQPCNKGAAVLRGQACGLSIYPQIIPKDDQWITSELITAVGHVDFLRWVYTGQFEEASLFWAAPGPCAELQSRTSWGSSAPGRREAVNKMWTNRSDK